MPKPPAQSGRNPADPYQHCRPRAHQGRAELIWAVVASSAAASWEGHHRSIVIGVLLWLINNYIPMDAKIKSILNIVVVVVVVLWLLNLLGLMDSLRGIRIGR